MEWAFIVAILIKFGFGPQFIKFIQATRSSATSTVLINGRLSPRFNIRRSVKQGCLLSPLLFVIALDALSRIIQNEAEQGTITGVEIEELGIINAHSFYADDVRLIVSAQMPTINQCIQLFDCFGKAAGLYYNWNETKVVHLLQSPLSQELDMLQWKWEDATAASRYLGTYVAEQILHIKTMEALRNALQRRLKKVDTKKSNLVVRVLLVNQYILVALWYLLSLWLGDSKDLEARD